MKKTLEIEVYTDGACSGNPGPGGIGYAILEKGASRQAVNSTPLHCGYRRTTNNRMEILAAAKGLKAALAYIITYGKQSRDIDIKINVYSDSRDLVKTMNEGWKKKANKDLWAVLENTLAEVQRHSIEVEFHWVKGHADNRWNKLADALAVQARQDPLFIDEVYERISPEGDGGMDKVGKNPDTSSAACREPEIVNICLCGHSTPQERRIEILLSNGTTVKVLPCHGGFEQTECTRAESAVTVDIAWKYVGWLNGRSL